MVVTADKLSVMGQLVHSSYIVVALLWASHSRLGVVSNAVVKHLMILLLGARRCRRQLAFALGMIMIGSPSC